MEKLITKDADTEVLVLKIPKCDFCSRPAQYDARMKLGAWSYLCQEHFRRFGVGLGLGKGQKLRLEK